jgi:RES domain-containing protein
MWRLDRQEFAAKWDSGIGAQLEGGRWNPPGKATVYCSLDPATCILEVAVHKGFRALERVPHVLTSARIEDMSKVHVVRSDDIPDPAWLLPGIPLEDQQAFGLELLRRHAFVAIPSAVSRRSWNVFFDPVAAKGLYGQIEQEALMLDPRLVRG